jgi:hypothetical protein
MEYQVRCGDHKVSMEITDIFDHEELARLCEEYLEEDILEARWIARDELPVNPVGFFSQNYIDGIGDKLLDQMRVLLERDLGDKILFEFFHDNEKVNSHMIDLDELLENFWMYQEGYPEIDTGGHVIEEVRAFLTLGKWKFGIKDQQGRIYDYRERWPETLRQTDARSILPNGFSPILWFGLANEPPLPAWSLEISEYSTLQRTISYTEHGLEKQRTQQQWQIFWGENFWTLHWPSMGDFDHSSMLTWMFMECGMEEPVDEFHRVIASCPIELNVSDTNGQLTRKLEELILTHSSV